ncbi:MAG: glycogen/starch synthase, partial [Verrucomicrobia bacterium]|nr:glycogen/starch synthase [Verrucomicrobiota bacterium]
MHIIHIASELAPIAKVGGLGDVLYGLCKELHRQGHTVTIILPKYDTINYNLLKNLQVHYRDLWSYDGPNSYHNTIWSANLDDLHILLVEAHHPNYPFSRGSIYGSPDDIDRFFYFSRTCMEYLFKSNTKPDILHVHDWQTALIPILQKDMYQALGWKSIKTILTLHNLEHQGKCFPYHLTRTGLKGDDYLFEEKLQDPQNHHLLNILKGAILYADAITTVSSSYKKEIMKPPGGFGLHET